MSRYAIIHKPSGKYVTETQYGVDLIDNQNGILTYTSKQDAENGWDEMKENYVPEKDAGLEHFLGGTNNKVYKMLTGDDPNDIKIPVDCKGFIPVREFEVVKI